MQLTKEKRARIDGSQERGRLSAGHRLCSGILALIKGLLLTVTLIIVAVLSLEFLFSLAHIGEDTVAAPDPLLGYVHLNNQSLTYRQEGYSRSRTNSMGFREREFATQKPADRTRVCVLGDSMTVGMEVPPEKTYTRLLENRLRESGKNWEVLNCGMSGYGSGQEYLLYRQKLEAFRPDILIVTYNIGDSEDSVFQRGGMNPPRPIFRVEHGVLKAETGEIDKWCASNEARFYSSFDWLRRNSRVLAVLSKLNLDMQNSDQLYKTLQNTAGKTLAQFWNKVLEKLPAAAPEPPDPALLQTVFADANSYDNSEKYLPNTPIARPSANPSYQELSRSFEIARSEAEVQLGILRALNNDCKRNKTKLVLVTGPAISNSMFYFRELEAMRKLASNEGFTLIEANKAFPVRNPMQESPLFFGLHFTRAGHKLMSEAIYSGLEHSGMLQ